MFASALLAAVPVPLCHPPQFGPPRPLTAAVDRPGALQFVDLDGDGDLDLLHGDMNAPGTFAYQIAWHEGLGGGVFGALHMIYDIGGATLGPFTAGDVDGDGDADVVSLINGNAAPTGVVVLLNQGDGSFAPALTVATLPGSSSSLALADMDLDGDDDIVASGTPFFIGVGGARMVVIESLGGGTFAPPVDVDASGAHALAIVTGDVDADGDPDIVTKSPQDEIVWYRNDGTFPFAGPALLPGTSSGTPVAIDDVDGDGIADVVIAEVSAGSVAWSPNQGASVFGAPRAITGNPVMPGTIGVRDLDLDGAVDVYCVMSGVGPVWLPNAGSGTFLAFEVVSSLDLCGGDETFMTDGDADGDGRPDLATVCPSTTVAWTRNEASGGPTTFVGRDEITSRARRSTDVITADLDGDGVLDVIASTVEPNFGPSRVVVGLGGPGGPGFVDLRAVITHSIQALDAGDIDSDGDVDVVCGVDFPGGVFVLMENVGAGELSMVGALAGTRQYGFCVADVDGDGDDDIAFFGFSGTQEVSWFEQIAGTLAPTPQPLTDLSPPGGSVINWATLLFPDIDGDGIPDLVAQTSEQGSMGTVLVRLGLGGGQFGPRTVVRAPQPGQVMVSVDVADIDGDGAPDLLVSGDLMAPSLAWFRNLGGGQFGAETVIDASDSWPSDVVAADFDLDGDIDILSPLGHFFASDTLLYWTNRGNGTFDPAVPVAFEPERFVFMTSGDFDLDGDVDVVSGSGGETGLFVVRNEANPSLGIVECTGLPNSTGAVGSTGAFGSLFTSANDLRLRSADLPLQSFGYYLTSLTPGFVVGPGGSQGILCLGGSVGRFVGPGQVMSSGATGAFALDIDLTDVPQPTGGVQVVAGQTWRFQAWHRDSVAGQVTSNFTDGIAVTFR